MERNVLKLIGYPLGHSLSPKMQKAAIDSTGLELVYEVEPLTLEQLPDFVAEVKKEGSPVLGFNVTIPYKEKIIPYLDEIQPEAATIGAVNTVKYEGGRLRGFNTDGAGLLKSMEEKGISVTGKKVLFIGSGGAARGISITMAFKGMERIDFVTRKSDSDFAMALRDQIKGMGDMDSDCYLLEEATTLPFNEYDVIVQATPVEMEGMDGRLEFPFDLLREDTILVDVVYAPRKTPFLAEGEKRGHRILNGLGMLVYQGALAFEIWTGKAPDAKAMERAIDDE